MTQQPSYKVLFTFIEIDRHLWSLSDCKQPSLWPLLCKKVYTTVYFPWILHSSYDLEADSARSFQNAFYKCSRVLNIVFSKKSYIWWMSSFFSLSSHLKNHPLWSYYVGGPDGKMFGSRSGRTDLAQWGPWIVTEIVATVGFQFGLYHVIAPLSFLRSINLASLFVNKNKDFIIWPLLFFSFLFFWWNEVAPGPYAFLVGLYAFSRPYHFDAYGPHTGPFFLRFCKEIARGAVRVIW